MKYFFIILLVVLVTGCTQFQLKTPDCEVNYTGLFMDMDAASAKACGGSVDVAKSRANTEVAGGVINAAQSLINKKDISSKFPVFPVLEKKP